MNKTHVFAFALAIFWAVSSPIKAQDYSGPSGWREACGEHANTDLFTRALVDERRQIVRDLLLRFVAEQSCMITGQSDILRPMLRDNAQWLKTALQHHNLLSVSFAGEAGANAAFLIVQHADHDPEWQREILTSTVTPLYNAGDIKPRWYAMLVDRVAVNGNQPQIYGSQGRCVSTGNWQPRPMIDPENVDARRAAVSMQPMAEYRALFRCN